MFHTQSNSEPSEPKRYKVSIVGDIGVGKTKLVKRLIDGSNSPFTQHYKSTIGVDFATHTPKSTTEPTRLQLWDIAGQERFSNTLQVYLKNSDAFVVCYDSTRPSTYDSVTKWVKCIKKDHPDTPIMLLCLKSDIASNEPEKSLQAEQLANKAKEIGAMLYFEVSAKEFTNAEEAMTALANELLSNEKKLLVEEFIEVQADNTTAEPILRIQKAAHEAQQTRSKKPYLWPDNTTLPEVQAYADKKAHSHTALAVKLNNKYPAWDKPESANHKADKINLIIEARTFLQSKNGLFKKDARDLSKLTFEQIEAIPEEKPHSCTAIFVKGLRKANQ